MRNYPDGRQFSKPEVGANFQDHVGTTVTHRLKGVRGLHNADKGLNALWHRARFAFGRKGLLWSNLLQSGACLNTNGDGHADVQFDFAPFAPGPPGQLPLNFHATQVHPMTMRPKSRGRLTLASNDPADDLEFKARMLQHPVDMDTLRRGVRFARETFNQADMRESVGKEDWPGLDIDALAGSNNLDDAIRAHARTIFHPAATCRMGDGPSAVVDAELRVNGVENLRVADGSVMPALVSGNKNAPTIVIAGRAADFILSTQA